MESVLDKTNLDIDSMLISWGLITGRYQDGAISSTKEQWPDKAKSGQF